MGLDVYLYWFKDFADTKEREDEYQDCTEGEGGGFIMEYILW